MTDEKRERQQHEREEMRKAIAAYTGPVLASFGSQKNRCHRWLAPVSLSIGLMTEWMMRQMSWHTLSGRFD